MPIAILSQSKLKELFDYDPLIGVLVWRTRPREHFSTDRGWSSYNARFSGNPAGGPASRGYLRVFVDGSSFLVHRIIYKLIHGLDPEQIDHINGVRDDNRASNLRSVTGQVNHQNIKLPANNTSGIIGVNWSKQKLKWRAIIRADGKDIHIGSFDDIEDAAAARLAAEIKYGFHKNHGRIL